MNQSKSINHGACKTIVGVAMLCGSGVLPVSATGLSALQTDTLTAVGTVCGGMAAAGFNIFTTSPANAQVDLFNQCNSILRTNAFVNGGGVSPVANSLDLTQEQLGSAIQNISTEEMATPSRISLSTLSGQNAEVTAHMFKLHSFGQGFGGGSGDDEGSLLPNEFSVFVNGTGGFGDIKSSDRENQTDFYTAGVIVGVDYRINENFVAGMAAGYSHLNSDFQSSTNVAGGGIDSDTYNISLFGSFDLNNFYVDGNFTYGWSDFEVDRRIVVLSNSTTSTGGANRIATSTPDGESYSAGFGFGYNHQEGAFNIRPYARLDYSHGNIDGYSESGAFGLNFTVDEQNFESLQTVTGFAVSFASSHSFGVIIPQIDFGWHHEFLNKSRGINARYSADVNGITFSTLTDNPDEDYFTLGFGLSTVLQGGMQLFFNHQSLLGYSNIDSHSFEAGVRFEF